MADMIGLLRFGMPGNQLQPVQPVEPVALKSSASVTSVQGSSGGAQANANYTALPRPVVLPQFVAANAPEAEPQPQQSAAGSIILKFPEPFDEHVLTGPPPTFEATLLELEAHLRLSLAKIEALRSANQMQAKPAPEPPKPPAPVAEAAPVTPPEQSALPAETAKTATQSGFAVLVTKPGQSGTPPTAPDLPKPAIPEAQTEAPDQAATAPASADTVAAPARQQPAVAQAPASSGTGIEGAA